MLNRWFVPFLSAAALIGLRGHAAAQIGPPPGEGSHWQIAVSSQGQTTYNFQNADGTTSAWTVQWGNPDYPPYIGPGQTGTITATGTCTMTAIWVDYMGVPTVGAPAKFHAIINLDADWGYAVNNPGEINLISHSADDGWADAEVVTANSSGDGQQGISTGRHLLTMDGSSGYVTFTRSIAASVSIQSGNATGSFHASCGMTASEDPRGAWISSSVDPTYSRGQDPQTGAWVRVLNVQDQNGAMQGDTVWNTPAPSDQQITYMANVLGTTWGAYSSFHWMETLLGNSADGMFNPPTVIPALPITYQHAGDSIAKPITPDHIELRLIDSTDSGLQILANYWMHFHDTYEDWNPDDSRTVSYPRDAVDYPGDWQDLMLMDNPSSGTIQFTLNVSKTVSDTESGSIEGGVGGTIDAVTFSVKEGVQLGQTKSYTFSARTTWNCQPYTRETACGALESFDLFGTASFWNASGYVGDLPWQCHKVTSTPASGVKGVSTYPH